MGGGKKGTIHSTSHCTLKKNTKKKNVGLPVLLYNARQVTTVPFSMPLPIWVTSSFSHLKIALTYCPHLTFFLIFSNNETHFRTRHYVISDHHNRKTVFLNIFLSSHSYLLLFFFSFLLRTLVHSFTGHC